MHADVVVIGAGPAGLRAALAAADHGLQVVVVDGNAAVGGQYFRQRLVGPEAGGSAGLPGRLGRVGAHPRVSVVPGSWVWGAERSPTGVLVHVDGATTGAVTATAAVVATGAAELTLPFPGWTLPGVVTPGAAQALWKGQRVRIGRRVVVGGSGPFLLPVAAGLSGAGVEVAALVEATRPRSVGGAAFSTLRHPARIREAAGYLTGLARAGVRPRGGRAVIRCEGTDRVEAAVVAQVDRDWSPIPGTERTIAADAVCVSFGFSAALDVSRSLGCADVPHPSRPVGSVCHDDDQATTVEGVFAAGETTGVCGVRVAEAEGHVAGVSAARLLGAVTAADHAREVRPLRRVLTRQRRFAALLDRLYPLGSGWTDWLEDDTVFCRCEEVPWRAVSRSTGGGSTARTARAVTRCGMGYCQGRICGPPLQSALAHRTGRDPAAVGDLQWRTIVTPTPLGVIADAGITSAAGSARPAGPA